MSLFRKVCILAALSIAAFASAASSQWKLKAPPPSSPYWWTLTEDIKPSELRRILTSRKEHRERYLLATEQGEASPLSSEDLANLSYFVNGGMTPELFRLSETFDAFSAMFDSRENWEQLVRETFPKYKISQDGQKTILDAVEPKNVHLKKLISELSVGSDEFVEILREIEKTQSSNHLSDVLKRRDFKEMSMLTGRSVEEIRALAETWQRDPVEEVCLEAIEDLRKSLSNEDWNAFRTYLLHEVAPGMAVTGFDDYLVENI